MRRAIPLLLVFVVSVLTCCNRFETRKILRKMIGSTVVLPEKMTCVQHGEVFPMPEELRSRPKLIVFVDSTECSKCRIDNIVQYGSLLDLSKNTETSEVMFLLSPKKTKCQYIVNHLVLSMAPYLVVIDSANIFREDNPIIPDNSAMHTLTVDSDNRVLLVGNPQMINLFNNV